MYVWQTKWRDIGQRQHEVETYLKESLRAQILNEEMSIEV